MNICIYGSASKNLDKQYINICQSLGREISKRGHNLVFGGGSTGLMGATAEGVAENGGEILAIVPRFVEDTEERSKLSTDLIETETISERKDLFQINADAFVILPGGIGTLDEFFETIEYKILGQQDKPVVLFNINGYYDKLEEFMKIAQEQKFIRVSESKLYDTATTVEEVFKFIEQA